MKETDMMTAANPPERRPTNIWAEAVMNILMKDTSMMTTAKPPELRHRHDDSCKPPERRPTNIWA